MAAYDHCQSEEFRMAASPITGNHLQVNLSYDKVYIPRDMDLGVARRIRAELPGFWKKQASEMGNSWKSSIEMRAAYYAFADVQTRHDFMSAVDQMLRIVVGAKEPRAQVYRAQMWLTRLWAHGLIAIPPKWTCEYKINCPISNFTVGSHLAWLDHIAAATSLKSARERRRTPGLALRIATTAVGVREPGDLTPATTSETVLEAMGTRASGIIAVILGAQRVRYGAAVNVAAEDWGLKRYRVRKKSDSSFHWAVMQDPALDLWRRYLAEWFAERPVKSQALKLGEFFLNYLLANPSVTRNPEEFCRRTYVPAVPTGIGLNRDIATAGGCSTPIILRASFWIGCWIGICQHQMTTAARFAAQSTGTR